MITKCGIYKFTSETTGLSYIGQSIDIDRRYKEHQKRDRDYSFYNAIKEHGQEDFDFEILELCEKEKLNEREKYWIAYYNSYYHGYNETPGGEGSYMSGKKKPVAQYDLEGNFIQIFDSIIEAERSLGINRGASNITKVCKGLAYEDHNFQWRYLDDVKDNYENNIGKSLRHQKCQEGALKGYFNQSLVKLKKVAKCDKITHKILKEYNSIKEAGTDNNINVSCIYRVCNGERKSSGGFYWKYI